MEEVFQAEGPPSPKVPGNREEKGRQKGELGERTERTRHLSANSGEAP